MHVRVFTPQIIEGGTNQQIIGRVIGETTMSIQHAMLPKIVPIRPTVGEISVVAPRGQRLAMGRKTRIAIEVLATARRSETGDVPPKKPK